MDCLATHRRKFRRLYTLAAVLFILSIALQSSFADQGSSSPPDAISEKVAPAPAAYSSFRPFSKIAVGVSVGSLGTGIEIATPLSRRTNLRVDGYLFNYSHTFSQDGVSYGANLHLRDFRASYDFIPFHGGFRLSGGLAVYNEFNVKAAAVVPAGSTITLNDVDYYSSTSDPLHGKATVAYGRKVAPTLTFGWGNAIPRSGRHLAFPVEIGAAFTGTPTFKLNMAGSACQTSDPRTCQVIATYSDFESNLDTERKKINDDIAPLRVYPIINVGVTYRF